jgi:hypothetical protein
LLHSAADYLPGVLPTIFKTILRQNLICMSSGDTWVYASFQVTDSYTNGKSEVESAECNFNGQPLKLIRLVSDFMTNVETAAFNWGWGGQLF